MCNSGDIKRKNIVFEICLVLVFCTIHLLIVPDFGDDIKFVKIMERYDYNIYITVIIPGAPEYLLNFLILLFHAFLYIYGKYQILLSACCYGRCQQYI